MSSATSPKRMGFWLSLGIIFMPYFFAWFLLQPGYGRMDRIVGFGWLVVLVLGFSYLAGADLQASTHAREFCSRFAVGGDFEQAVDAALSDAAAAARRSKGEKGEDILYVTGKADRLFYARTYCEIDGRNGRITNVGFLTVGVD